MLNQDWTNEWHMDLSWNLGSPMRQTWMLYDVSIVRCIKSNSARKFWLTLYYWWTSVGVEEWRRLRREQKLLELEPLIERTTNISRMLSMEVTHWNPSRPNSDTNKVPRQGPTKPLRITTVFRIYTDSHRLLTRPRTTIETLRRNTLAW